MALCTVAELIDLFSLEGVIQASNDGDEGDAPNTSRVDNAIERAEQILKQYIAGRYNTDDLTSNTWAKWSCALIAVVQLFRRRGNPIPAGLEENWKELLDQLEMIRDGKAEVPDGQPRIEPGLVMSNIRFDARFPTQKIRAQTTISSGQQESSKIRRTDPRDVLLQDY